MTWKRKPIKNRNPLLDGTRESSGKHGVISEDRMLNDLGAQKTIGSGAFRGHKSDGLKSVGEVDLRIECKSTRKESIGLKYSWLLKITEEAIDSNRTPILTISFVRGDGSSKPSGDWVMMPAHLFKEICDEAPES